MLNNKLCLGYCPDGNGHNTFPFNRIFPEKKNIEEGFEGVDAVIFWGGIDIHPSLYNEARHPLNQTTGPHISRRDKFEWKAMAYCYLNRIPMIGVCRGAQLMCAFAGGRLVQHTVGHTGGDHYVTTSEGECFPVTSCHHQMMYPFEVPHEMLAYSTNKHSSIYEGAGGAPMLEMADKPEPEIVYFPRINGLAIQGHPEWAKHDSDFANYCTGLVQTHLLTEVASPL